MIDLHCHILPGLDDGAPDLATSLEMARAFVADGVSVVVCTPHILPGLYHNTADGIRAAVTELQAVLDREGIPLRLLPGADNHIAPDCAAQLRNGQMLAIADTRYVLIEPPHHVVPQRMEAVFFDLQVAGYVPILTHPERLRWIDSQYDLIRRLADAGVWIQITAGSLAGSFGSRAQYWAERMLDEGYAHILATDAHDVRIRKPDLSRGWDLAARRIGKEEAHHLVSTRPKGVLDNCSSADLPHPQSRYHQRLRHDGAESAGLESEKAEPCRAAASNHRGVRGLAGRLRRLLTE